MSQKNKKRPKVDCLHLRKLNLIHYYYCFSTRPSDICTQVALNDVETSASLAAFKVSYYECETPVEAMIIEVLLARDIHIITTHQEIKGCYVQTTDTVNCKFSGVIKGDWQTQFVIDDKSNMIQQIQYEGSGVIAENLYTASNFPIWRDLGWPVAKQFWCDSFGTKSLVSFDNFMQAAYKAGIKVEPKHLTFLNSYITDDKASALTRSSRRYVSIYSISKILNGCDLPRGFHQASQKAQLFFEITNCYHQRSRVDAEKLLGKDGDFLIRPSSIAEKSVLSYRSEGKFVHKLISKGVVYPFPIVYYFGANLPENIRKEGATRIDVLVMRFAPVFGLKRGVVAPGHVKANFSDFRFYPPVLDILLKSLKGDKMVKLKLENNNYGIGDESGCRLIQHIEQNNIILRELSLPGRKVQWFAVSPANSSFSWKLLRQLQSVIVKFSMLTVLSIPFNYIGDEGAECLSSIATKSSTLKKLVLEGVRTDTTRGLATLYSGVAKSSSIINLDLSHTFFLNKVNPHIISLFEVLKTNTVLEELSIQSLGLSNFGMAQLCSCLNENNTLQKIVLGKVCCDQSGIDELGKTKNEVVTDITITGGSDESKHYDTQVIDFILQTNRRIKYVQ
mmetsp:Transcript_5685/g.6167  ORF Transcript_5685/g.6167 Transcript_5685/m.6167 type:complete len:618 (+) Transcript_5685:261-2114(+)